MKDLKILMLAVLFILFITLMLHGVSLITGETPPNQDHFPYRIYWLVPALVIVCYLVFVKFFIPMIAWAGKDPVKKCANCGKTIGKDPYSGRLGKYFCSLQCDELWTHAYMNQMYKLKR